MSQSPIFSRSYQISRPFSIIVTATQPHSVGLDTAFPYLYCSLFSQETDLFFLERISRNNIDEITRESRFVSVHNMKEHSDIRNRSTDRWHLS